MGWKYHKAMLTGVLAIGMLVQTSTGLAKGTKEIYMHNSLKDGVYDATVVTGDEKKSAFPTYSLHVTVTVQNHAITGVSYNGAVGENATYAQQAYEEVSKAVLGKNQSTIEVDAVSGATESGDAFVEAIQEGIDRGSFVGPQMHDIVVNARGMQICFAAYDGAEGYRLYRNGKKIADLKDTAFLDTNAKQNGKKYKYSVTAIVGGVESDPSQSQTVYYLSKNKINALLNGSAGKMTFAWRKNTKADGYRIQYSTKSSFENAKTMLIRDKKLVIATVHPVSRGKTYYVRVCAYKKVKGKMYYGNWSKSKKLHINR